jgi:hypothetical protein
MFVAASRNVALLPKAYRYNFYTMPDWWFLLANAREPVTTAFTFSLDLQAKDAIASINRLCFVFILVMVLEGMVVVPLAVVYMYYLLRDMCRERASLFTVFLRVPRPTVVAIVKQKLKVGDADEDDEEAPMEDQAAVQEASKGADDTWASGAGKGVKYAIQWGRKLDYNHWDMWRMVSPLCVWAALLITCYGVSYHLLKESIPSISNVAANGRVMYLVAGLRWSAFEAVTQPTLQARVMSQQSLNTTAYDTRAWFEQLCFGSGVNPIDPATMHFKYQMQGASLGSAALIDAFYYHNCFRQYAPQPAPACLLPGQPYQIVTQSGLLQFLYEYMDESVLLSEAADTDLTLSEPHFQMLWVTGVNDLQAGFNHVHDLFAELCLVNENKEVVLESVVFAIMCVGAVAYYLFQIRPFVHSVQLESKRTAELLSQLPSDINVPDLMTAPKDIKKGSISLRMVDAS